MKKKEQPAKINFFFGPGWKKLGLFIQKFWEYNQEDIRNKAAKVEGGKGIMSLPGAGRLLSCFSLILFGTFFFLLISGSVSLVFGIAFLVIYVVIFLIWSVDRIYLLKNRIFVACPNCKAKFLVPTYICPGCNEKHTRLVPGKYGVFYRTCNCGLKIPTHVMTHRSKLEAICPKCETPLKSTGSRPICVPIVGGRSSGKTAYINAFSYEFIEKVAPRNGLTVSHYNDEMKDFYEKEITGDFMGGTTRMTKTEVEIQKASSKAFSFLIYNDKLKPERLIQIYDVAGESFVENLENEIQLQYTYCHGIIFMLDPLSIPVVRNYITDQISDTDRKSLGTLDVELVLDAFQNKLRTITWQSESTVFTVPIAIVISKCDIKTLEQFIGEDVISEFMTERGLDMKSYAVAEDYVCRKFLMENGLASFVANIDMKFKNNHYFKCSSIGHTRETGRYNPKGVLEPMEWIFQTADPGLKKAIQECNFEPVIRE